jgi:hypothetical protein
MYIRAQRSSKGLVLLYPNLGARWMGWSSPRPRRTTPERAPVPIGGGRVTPRAGLDGFWRRENPLPVPGIELQDCDYTDYAIPAAKQ